jgi:hypothetical protein
MAHDVFISYSTKDKSTADAVCHYLEDQGVRCWIAPRDIPYGSDWSEQIIRALDESRALVLVFSSSTNESKQVMRELSYAADRGIPILPLRIEDILPSKGFRYYLGVVHWLDALSPPLEMHLERLANRVSALLVADQAPEPRGRRSPQSPSGGEGSEAGAKQSSTGPESFSLTNKDVEPERQAARSSRADERGRQRWRRRLSWRTIAMSFGALALLLGGIVGGYYGVVVTGGVEQPPPIEVAEEKPPPTPDKKTQEKKKEDTQTVTIRVTGTPGVAFSGGYGASGGSYSPVEGVTPQDFEVEVGTRREAEGVAANVKKRDEGNEELMLQLLVGGEVVREQSTTAQFGGVSV